MSSGEAVTPPSPRLRASTEKTRPSVFWPLAAVIAPLIALLFKLEIEGAEKLPREGAYVLAPNHYSEADPLAVALAVWKIGPRTAVHGEGEPLPGAGARLDPADHRHGARSRDHRPRHPPDSRSRPPRRS